MRLNERESRKETGINGCKRKETQSLSKQSVIKFKIRAKDGREGFNFNAKWKGWKKNEEGEYTTIVRVMGGLVINSLKVGIAQRGLPGI